VAAAAQRGDDPRLLLVGFLGDGGYWGALAAILAGYLLLTQWAKARLVRRFGLD
jgi:hypothetical protein